MDFLSHPLCSKKNYISSQLTFFPHLLCSLLILISVHVAKSPAVIPISSCMSSNPHIYCKCGWSVLLYTMAECTATKRLMSLNVLFRSNGGAIYSCYAYYLVWLSSQWSVKQVCSSVWVERSARRWPWASPGLQSAMPLNTEDPRSRGPPLVKGPFSPPRVQTGLFLCRASL